MTVNARAEALGRIIDSIERWYVAREDFWDAVRDFASAKDVKLGEQDQHE